MGVFNGDTRSARKKNRLSGFSSFNEMIYHMVVASCAREFELTSG